jgi:hypothetical protein
MVDLPVVRFTGEADIRGRSFSMAKKQSAKRISE